MQIQHRPLIDALSELVDSHRIGQFAVDHITGRPCATEAELLVRRLLHQLECHGRGGGLLVPMLRQQTLLHIAHRTLSVLQGEGDAQQLSTWSRHGEITQPATV